MFTVQKWWPLKTGLTVCFCLQHVYDHAGLFRIYGMAYKSSSGTISSIKKWYILKIIDINCRLFLSSHSINDLSCLMRLAMGEKVICTLLNRGAAALITHSHALLSIILFIDKICEDWNVWWHCLSWSQTIVLSGNICENVFIWTRPLSSGH